MAWQARSATASTVHPPGSRCSRSHIDPTPCATTPTARRTRRQRPRTTPPWDAPPARPVRHRSVRASSRSVRPLLPRPCGPHRPDGTRDRVDRGQTLALTLRWDPQSPHPAQPRVLVAGRKCGAAPPARPDPAGRSRQGHKRRPLLLPVLVADARRPLGRLVDVGVVGCDGVLAMCCCLPVRPSPPSLSGQLTATVLSIGRRTDVRFGLFQRRRAPATRLRA